MWELNSRTYTPMQRELFAFLPQDGSQIGTKELVYLKLRRGPWDVRYPHHIILIIMARLARKLDRNKEAFVLRQSKGPRVFEKKFWLEPRPSQRTSPRFAAGSTRMSVLD